MDGQLPGIRNSKLYDVVPFGSSVRVFEFSLPTRCILVYTYFSRLEASTIVGPVRFALAVPETQFTCPAPSKNTITSVEIEICDFEIVISY